jgi:3-hydroxyacyl-[acyl-carrier-protein] dehydratase
VSIIKKDDRLVNMKVEGRVGERSTLSGRLVLERYNLAEREPEKKLIDDQLKQYFRRMQSILLPIRPAADGASRAGDVG